MHRLFSSLALLFCWACSSPATQSSGGGSTGDGISPTASRVSVEAPQAGALADGTEAVTLRAVLVDPQGKPVAGASVDFVVSGTGNHVSAAAVTDAQGATTAELTSTHGETKTVGVQATRAGAAAVQLAGTVQVPFIARVLVLDGDMGPLPADGNTLARLTVTVTRGSGGAVMPGVPVTWAVGGHANELRAGSATDASGQAQATVASVYGETKAVIVGITGGEETAQVQVAFSSTNLCAATSLLAGLPWLATPLGQGPAAQVDMNEDGHLDLVQAGLDSNIVYVHPGLGDGLFAEVQTVSFPDTVDRVMAVDVNGDGHVDLVAAASNLALSMFTVLGGGGGALSAPMASALPSDSNGQVPANIGGVLTAKLTGDGATDIAVYGGTNMGSGYVLILHGDGQGHFTADTNMYLTTSSFRAIAPADLNGDGIADLAAIMQHSADSNVYLVPLLNDGSGTFADNGAAYGLGKVSNGIVQVQAMYLDGDAHTDLVATGGGSVISFLGNGQGAMTQAQSFAEVPSALDTGDVNGDGKQDIMVVSITNLTPPTTAARVYINAGDGNLAAPVSHPTSFSQSGYSLADFNEDGILDRVTTVDASQSIAVSLGTPGDAFGSAGDFIFALPSSTSTSPQGLASADFDHDGYPDLLAENDGSLVLLLNEAATASAAPLRRGVLNDLPARPGAVVVVDVNQDGNQDFVVADASANTLGVMLGAGDANFVASQQPNCNYPATTLTAADLNHDGYPDLVATHGGSSVDVLLNVDRENFADATSVSLGASSSVTNTAVVDVTGDGNADILVANANELLVLAGDGNGAFAAPVVAQDLQAASGGHWAPTWILAQDLSGDGNIDVVVAGTNAWQNTGPAFVALLGHGDGTFTAGAPFGTVGQQAIGTPVLQDTDGDAIADLVMPNWVGYVAVLHGHGDGSFDPGAYYGSGVTRPQLAVAQDFDGDGRIDLAQLGLEGVQLARNAGCAFPVQTPVARGGCTAVASSVWALIGVGVLLRRLHRRATGQSARR